MATTAEDRGWGHVGLPGSPDGIKYRKNNIAKITTGGRDLWVHEKIALLAKAFIDEIVRRGYPIDKVLDDWGYNHRYIAGTSILSNHSWGLALDLNAQSNPMTHDDVVHTDMPSWVPQVALQFGFNWGGNYIGSKKDPMHFEFLGTPEDADRMVKALTAQPPTQEDYMDLAESPSWAKRQPNGRFPIFFAHYEPATNSVAVASRDNATFSPKWVDGHKDAGSQDFSYLGLWWRRFFNTGPLYGFGEADGSFYVITQGGTYDLSKR